MNGYLLSVIEDQATRRLVDLLTRRLVDLKKAIGH